MFNYTLLLLLALASLLMGCGGGGSGGGGGSSPSPPPPTPPQRISIQGFGQGGIFDPSLEKDSASNRIWMSFSTLVPESPQRHAWVHTRLAHSDDRGTTWSHDGLINTAFDSAGSAWIYEVSRLVEDPFTTNPNERWLLVFNRYLRREEQPLFEHNWIGLRTAPNPLPGNWSAERKLFTGTAYDNTSDTVIGPPEVRMGALHADLINCQVPGEAGYLVTREAHFMSLDCANGDFRLGRIVLLRRLRNTSNWQYVGTLLDNRDAVALRVPAFTATDMESRDGRNFLLVSPRSGDDSATYLGCLAFEIVDLNTGRLERDGAIPRVLTRIPEKPGGFRGACGYEATSNLGIVYGDTLPEVPDFGIFASFLIP